MLKIPICVRERKSKLHDLRLCAFCITDIDAEMNDENGQWIILSETEEDNADASDENLGVPEEDCPENLLKKDRDALTVERETVNDHKNDAVTNVLIAAERQSVAPNAKPTKDATALGTPVKSHSVVSEAKNLLRKNNKDNKNSARVKCTKKINATSSELDKHSKEANTDSTNIQNKDSNTPQTVSEHSNTEPSAEDKYKKSNTTSAKVQHSKSSNTPPSALDKTSNTLKPRVSTPMKKGSMTSPLIDIKKTSTTASPVVAEKNRNTVTSTMDNKDINISPSVVNGNKKGGDASLPALSSHSRSSNTVPQTVSKNKNVTPLTQDEKNTRALTLDKLDKKNSTTPKALNKHGNTASPALNKPSNRAPSALDRPNEDRSPSVSQFPCLAKPQSTHNKTDNYEASDEQGIAPDPQKAEEDFSDVEVLSNTNSVETIILTSSDVEQENLGYSTEDCQSIKIQAIPYLNSQPCAEGLDCQKDCSLVESALSQKDFCGAVITETESMMGGSSGGGDEEGSQPLGRKSKLLFSNRSSAALSSSSTSRR